MALRHWACTFLAIFTLILLYSHTFISNIAVDDGTRDRVQNKPANAVTPNAASLAMAFKRKYGQYRVLEDSICVDDGKRCTDVRDHVRRTRDGKRFVYYEGMEVTAVRLKIPQEANVNNIDTSTWPLAQNYQLPGTINAVSTKEMFVTGAIPMKRDVVANVLIIGMGAGALNSYLYTTYPKMNITVVELEPEMVRVALKWFNLTLDARQRVLTMDGLEFLENAVAQGFKYNAIHIDACVMNFTAEINCPAEPFLSSETVANVAKVLDQRGVVNLNVISLRLGLEKAAEKDCACAKGGLIQVMGAFAKHFHTCYSTAPARDKMNMIVTCTNSERLEDLSKKYERFVDTAD